MLEGDPRAKKIYQTIGTHLVWRRALRGVLRASTCWCWPRYLRSWRNDIVTGAREVLDVEFPELGRRIAFHMPDEQ
jgi:hypothetical protein